MGRVCRMGHARRKCLILLSNEAESCGKRRKKSRFLSCHAKHAFLIGKVSFVSQSGQAFLVFWQIWSLYCSAEMTDNPLHKIRNDTPRPSVVLLKEKHYPTWSLSLFSQKDNPGQFVRAWCCMSDLRRNPCKGSTKTLRSHQKTALYVELTLGCESVLGVRWHDGEQKLTLFKTESTHAPRK